MRSRESDWKIDEISGRHSEQARLQGGLPPLHLQRAAASATPPLQPSQDDRAGDQNGTTLLAGWPEKPEPVDPGDGTRADRRRMLQRMREVWGDFNSTRRMQVEAEVQVMRDHQAEVTAYWDRHRALVKEQWANRSGGRGQTTVADISAVSAQWGADNAASPQQVPAMAQRRGVASPHFWQCPLGLDHPAWPAWPKDRIQKGAGCPHCQKLIKLSDIPTLAEQYRGSEAANAITYGSNDEVPWVCQTWALDPVTGHWRRVEHRFDAVIKDRSQQGHGCLVCAGYVIDDTNSLGTWFPDLAEQLDDSGLDPSQLPTSAHNVSRRGHQGTDTDTGGKYATCNWRCQHGHRWKTTILSRVQGGDCPDCSTSGISKEQVRLVAELAWLMDLLDSGRPDPRLPESILNFASHKITIPSSLKPEHWRYRDVEVDARFLLPAHQIVLGLEYDGSFHHSNYLRERSQYESEKSTVLHEAGEVAILIHVRVGTLPPLETPYAMTVSVPERSTPYQQASAVAAAIEARYPGSIPKLAGYIADGRPRGQGKADAYILATWGQLRPPRPKRQRTEAPRLRRLRATEPHSNSLLAPIGDPYRNPERPAEILRDYICACGSAKKVTAVQSQVTSGNTRSCGCLQDQKRRQKRQAISREETQAAREWAHQNRVDIGGNGRLPDRIIASYRLSQANQTKALGPDGLLEEERVRQWAQANERPLAARGRIPSDLWLDFAEDYLAQRQ
jgi:hypothetical protein